MKRVIIIGSGFSSLSAASYMAKQGHMVTVLEKNEQFGGRASQLKKDGFTFDMGPTWYWMPDVFERYFADFQKKSSDFYTLQRLDPGYEVFFGTDDRISIDANLDRIFQTFEQVEPGSSLALKSFLKKAEYNYEVAIKDLVYRPGRSPLELITPKTITNLKQFFTKIDKTVSKKITNPKLQKILTFPVLFLGAKPSDTPSFYSFMNHADFVLGTWHPKGGMFEVAKGMYELAKSLGVKFHFNCGVQQIVEQQGMIKGVISEDKMFDADIVISGADYQHTEQLLDAKRRMYGSKYWKTRLFAPSALLFYVGFDTKLSNVPHHALFFDTDFDQHAKQIYDDPKWPNEPLFYMSVPSKTDIHTAPEGKESAIFLVPLAPDLEDSASLRETIFKKIMLRFEQITGQKVQDKIIVKESFGVDDFKTRYNSYKGNAYGLANTLLQTAFLRPKLKSKKVKGLYFTGQLTVPGPGVPPSLISGKVVSELIKKDIHESII